MITTAQWKLGSIVGIEVQRTSVILRVLTHLLKLLGYFHREHDDKHLWPQEKVRKNRFQPMESCI